MNKHIIIAILTIMGILSSVSVKAQDIYLEVTSFKTLTTDMDARIQAPVEDQNGEKCALIKVSANIKGLVFEAPATGIVKQETKNGEVWVYIPGGSRSVTILHDDFPPLRNYQYPVKIESAMVYEMKIANHGYDPNSNVPKMQKLNLKIMPANAMVLVDGDIIETSGGEAALELPVGNHNYNVAAKGYVGQSGTVTLKALGPSKLIVELERQKNDTRELKPIKIEKPKEQEVPQGDVVSEVEGVGQMFTVGGVEFLMVHVDAGTFTMGAHSKQVSPFIQERPAHEVTLTKDFYIAETEVTQALWKAVMDDNPSFDSGKNLPVEQVTWDDCQEFCRRLTERTGRKFRLPTSAEWEFAARGGNQSKDYTYSGSDNVDDVAWYSKNAGDASHNVKTKQPNELGLYDMSGNVWEWCLDDFTSYRSDKQTDPVGENMDDDRVIRGGSFVYDAKMVRTSNRFNASATSINNTFGMRLAMDK